MQATSMRTFGFVVLGLTALFVAPRPGEALPYYPWCAQSYGRSLARTCAFDTLEQCKETIVGIGGNCTQNLVPPPYGESQRARQHLLAAAAPREPRPYYPRCAQSYGRSNARTCGFDTEEQCLATISGIGGHCSANWLPAPYGESQRAKQRVLAAALAARQPREPPPYHPWCALSYGRSNARSCAFDTQEQCMATISGIGGSCFQNFPRRS
jgi:Protein of unknown function (DUF3551)